LPKYINPGGKTLPQKTSKTSRLAATEVLCSLYQKRSPVKQLFDQAVQKHRLPSRERNLAMQLIYGVLRQRQYLDRMLALLSRTPLHKINPFVHQALAVGLYQLFFLERIPESAAVNEAVDSCKAAKIPRRLHGFVNGILRQAIRQKSTLATEALTDDAGKLLLNHPDWLVKRWLHNFGFAETERLCRSNNCEPVLVLRVNSAAIASEEYCRSLDEAGIIYRPGSYSPDAIALPDFHGPISTIPGYAEGYFQVQDEAAQLATSLLGPFRQRATYLDACAGLGGKTAHLLQLTTQHDVQIHAVEPERHRLRKLRENISRLFPQNGPIIHEGTLQNFSSLHGDLSFDGILVDAPCSGTGVTGRHPDIRWNRRHEELVRYQKMQKDLLASASLLIKPSGILVYATCSLEPEENEHVVNDFLQSHPDFMLTDCATCLPEPARGFVENNFFAPHPSDTIDGFFAARLQHR
jgi:16S rRNA (cytosine967-C5)-methyltransferase